MDLFDTLQRISDGRLPEGSMAVKTTHKSSEIQIYGVSGTGLSVPVDEVEEFIAELEQKCTDPTTLYTFEDHGASFEIPGIKLSKAALYLREARDSGVHFAKYVKIF